MSQNIYPPQPLSQPGAQPAPAPVPPSALTPPLEVWGATDKGHEREGNEDALYPRSGSTAAEYKPSPENLARKGQLLVVADGVGGSQAGAEASRWAVRVAVERYYDLPGSNLAEDLRLAVEAANASLYQYLQSTGANQAGCTMAAAVVHGDVLYIANVGDSRVYVIRGGQAYQQTHDHTLTQQKIDRGLLRPEQAELDPDRSVLTRSMGQGPTVQVECFNPSQLLPGDVALLCSDGLPDMVGNDDIARLASSSSPKRAAQRLIAEANRRGGFDNITVVLARVGGKPLQAAGGGGLSKTVRDLADGARRMSRWQRIILIAMAAVVLLICVLLGWTMHPWRLPDSSPTPAAGTTPAVLPPTATNTLSTSGSPAPEGSPGLATSTPLPTSTPTETPRPPATTAAESSPSSTAGAPEPVFPEDGKVYERTSPSPFRWTGSLAAGQMFQVRLTADRGYNHASDSQRETSWAFALPAAEYGWWTWQVFILDGDTVIATSPSSRFCFNPLPGVGGGESPQPPTPGGSPLPPPTNPPPEGD